MEQTIVLTESELQLHGASTTVHVIPLGGTLDPLNVDHPVRDERVLAEAITSAGHRLNRRKGCSVLLPDSLVFAKVLTFDGIPFSLKKRDEMIRWKMDAFLPGHVESFNVQYNISGKTALVAAMANSTVEELTRHFSLLDTKCYSMVPESFHYANAFLEREKEGSAILLVNRAHHFSGLVVQNGSVSFVRFRKKIQGVSLQEELDMFGEMVNEKVPKRVLLFGEDAEIEAEVMGNRWLI